LLVRVPAPLGECGDGRNCVEREPAQDVGGVAPHVRVGVAKFLDAPPARIAMVLRQVVLFRHPPLPSAADRPSSPVGRACKSLYSSEPKWLAPSGATAGSSKPARLHRLPGSIQPRPSAPPAVPSRGCPADSCPCRCARTPNSNPTARSQSTRAPPFRGAGLSV